MTAQAEQLALGLEDAPKRRRAAALRSYHVSNRHTTVAEALAGERRASGQEARVLAWLRSCSPGSAWTPYQVWCALGGEKGFGPKTSLRRCLTNLTKRGLLFHNEGERRPGPHGAKESTWSCAA